MGGFVYGTGNRFDKDIRNHVHEKRLKTELQKYVHTHLKTICHNLKLNKHVVGVSELELLPTNLALAIAQ